jgi:HD-GYP domain-containing protein (c-di-GMP phosphodiesterase class II)
MRLRTKLILAFLCCFLVPFVPAAAVVYLRTTGGLTRIEGQVLSKACAGAENDLANQQIQQVGSLTASGQVQQLVARNDTAGVVRFLSALVNDRGFAEAEVVASGSPRRILAQVSFSETPVALSYAPSRALAQPTFAFENDLGEVWLVTTQPLAPSAGQTATLVCARQLDNATLAASAQRTGSQLSLYTGPVPARIATQLERVGFDCVASSLSFAKRQAALLMGPRSHTDSSGWTTTATTLDDATGRPVAVATVAVPDVAFASIRSSMTGALLLALFLALGTAIVATALLSQMIMRPVTDLANAARALAAGRPTQHLEVSGRDEMAEAARAFNEMSRQVAQTTEELTERIGGLSQELGDLSLVGQALTQSPDVKSVLRTVAARVRETTGSEFCGLHLVEGELLAPGLYAGHLAGSVQPIEELACRVVSCGEPLLSEDLREDPRVHPAERRTGAVAFALMAVPIAYQGRALGALTVGSPGARGHGPETAAVLQTVAGQIATALTSATAYQELERSYLQTVTGLAAALEAKDHYTAEHGESIGAMAIAVGRTLSLPLTRLRRLEYAAVLHDIGKIGIPLDILNKPGRLTEEEFAVMATHTVIAERIVSRIESLRDLGPILRAAHERWDGRGYPDGLAGEAIPLEARIIFVCDAYHAMTSDRPYREALTPDQAQAEVAAGSGSQFDPAVASAFLGVLPAVAGTTDAAASVSSAFSLTAVALASQP